LIFNAAIPLVETLHLRIIGPNVEKVKITVFTVL
jgi:hypothetical protein